MSGSRWPVVDYPPAYMLVLGALGELHAAACRCSTTGTLGLALLIKAPAMLADFGLAALLARIAARYASPDRAYGVFAAALLLPPLWLISAYWGQVDSVAACLLAAGLWAALERRSLPAWTLLTFAVLTKPQSLPLVVPFAIWEAFRPGAPARLAAAGPVALAAAYAVSLPFAPSAWPPSVLRWLFERYTTGLGKYPNSSSGGFNLYTVADGFFRSDARVVAGLPLHVWGVALVLALVAFVGITLVRRLRATGNERERERAFLAANFVILTGFFMLATRMHERYLLPGLAVGAVVAVFSRRYAFAELGLATVFVVNCAFVLLGFYGGSHHPLTLFAAHAFSLAGVASFALALATFSTGIAVPAAPRGTAPRPVPAA